MIFSSTKGNLIDILNSAQLLDNSLGKAFTVSTLNGFPSLLWKNFTGLHKVLISTPPNTRKVFIAALNSHTQRWGEKDTDTFNAVVAEWE